MISAVSSPRPRKAFLPAFAALAAAGFMAIAPFLAVLLLWGYAWMGVSLVSGYGLGMLIYGFLYGAVNQAFAVPAPSAKAKRRLPANFGLLLIGKLLVFGGAVAVLLCMVHVAALWMLAGVFLTQIGVTANIMRWLTDNKGVE